MKLWMNGTICDEHEAMVSVFDHGFLYGMGLFETFRTYGGTPFLLQEHLARLMDGCQELDIDLSVIPTGDVLSAHVQELLESNGLRDAYIRFSVSAGNGPLGLQTNPYVQPNLILYMKELPVFNPSLYEDGKALQRMNLRRNSPEGRLRRKSFHYMNSILAKQELGSYPWAQGAEGLMFNEHGQMAEGIVSNVFFIREGVCCTPALDTGILPGITRDCVMKLALKSGLRLQEGHYRWEDLLAAEEAFVTNSIQEIVPINRLFDIDGQTHVVGNGKVGRITAQLLKMYRALAKSS